MNFISKPELLVLVLTFIAVMLFIWFRIVNDLPDDFLTLIKRRNRRDHKL